MSTALAPRRARTPHPAEAVVDVAQDTAALDQGKRVLHAAIRREVERTLLPRLMGGHASIRLRLTLPMVGVLEALYRYGHDEALRQIARMGLTPRLAPVEAIRFAADREARRIDRRAVIPPVRPVVMRLTADLDRLAERIERDLADAATGEGLGIVPRLALQRLANVTGALDAASYLVIPPFNAGKEDVYRANADLFGGYVYSAAGDRNTCDRCDSFDGREYATLDDAARDGMDGFGPNPLCYGGTRCRCTLVPMPA